MQNRGTMNLKILKNDALLLLTAAIWGLAFVAQRVGMRTLGPFAFNGVRFALGSISLLPLIVARNRREKRMHPGSPRGGGFTLAPLTAFLLTLLTGTVLFAAASLQQVGIVYTTAGKSGFITGLYVVLVPLSGLIWGPRPGWGRWLGAVLAVTGLYFLTITEAFTINRGDFLVLVGALFWTAHVQLLGWLAPRTDALRLACLQFVVCAVFSLITAFILETVTLTAVLATAWPILYGGLGSVGIAYTLQVIAQREAHPTHAAIILSLEGVFAVLGGWLFIAETLSARGLLGCALMLAGMISAQVTLFSRSSRKASVSPEKANYSGV
jgi:drug/metabolite transporter (DMT)-like permease